MLVVYLAVLSVAYLSSAFTFLAACPQRSWSSWYPSALAADFSCPSLVFCSPILSGCSAVSPAPTQHRQRPHSSHAPASSRR